MEDHAILTVGDTVMLKNIKYRAFMGADGLLYDDVFVYKNPKSIFSCLFQINLQNQYSASRELEDFSKDCEMRDTSSDPLSVKFLEALEKGKRNERELNANYMKQKLGSKVKFGDIIQLRHIRSQKYLTVSQSDVAKFERENLRVLLVSDGNSRSWMQMTPRFKIDKEGDQIDNMNEVYLKTAERSNEYIRCADKQTSERYHELNCSLERTAWQVCLYQGSSSISELYFQAGDIVTLQDPEFRAHLRTPLLAGPSEDVDDDDTVNSQVFQDNSLCTIEGDDVRNPISVPYKLAYFESSSSSSSNQYGGGEVDSNCLWIIEKKDFGIGGRLSSSSREVIRLKHLNSNNYLSCSGLGGGDDKARQMFGFNSQSSDISTSSKKDSELKVAGLEFASSLTTRIDKDEETLIQLNTVHPSGDDYIHAPTAIQIYFQSSNSWLLRGGRVANNFCCRSAGDRSSSSALLLSASSISSSSNILRDVLIGIEIYNFLTSFLVLVSNLNWDDLNAKTAEFNSITEEIVSFVSVKSAMDDNVDEDKSKISLRRRCLLREQGSISQALSILEQLEFVSTTIRSSSSSSQLSIETKIGLIYCRRCLEIVYAACVDNSRNQLYVADRLSVLISHVGALEVAGKVVVSMLSSNMDVQESKVGNDEIRQFVNMIRTSNLNPMYLNLLTAVCSCKGFGVDDNQCQVCDAIFETSDTILIKTSIDDMNPNHPIWQNHAAYARPSKEYDVYGIKLIDNGIGKILLFRSSLLPESSTITTFGKMSIPLEDLCSSDNGVKHIPGEERTDGGGSPTRWASRVAALTEQTKLLGQYFVSQLSLAAEMCLDRNYAAMNKLEPLFPFDTLLTILKYSNLTDDYKASSVRLLTCMYVDRDPQTKIKIPRLSRLWSEVVDDASSIMLPSVDKFRRYRFSLLQDYVSQHIKSIHGVVWSELSLRVMQMLDKMIEFQFYSTSDQLEDIIGPLVLALDRRTMIIAAPTRDRGFSKTRQRSMMMKRTLSKKMSSKDMLTLNQQTDEEIKPTSGLKLVKYNCGLCIKKCMLPIGWQKRVFKFLESTPVMIAVLVLVFVAVGVSIHQTVDGAEGLAYVVFEQIVAALFLSEITLRIYCYYIVKKQFWSFFKNPYYMIDVCVVMLDYMIIGLGSAAGDAGGMTKSLRSVRLIRLARLLRAARAVRKIVDGMSVSKKKDNWIKPARYSLTKDFELKTMDDALQVMQKIQKIKLDKDLSMVTCAIKKASLLADAFDYESIFDDISNNAKNDLRLDVSGNLDSIILDLIMYEDQSLVQQALNVLKNHHSQCQALEKTSCQLHLIIEDDRERQFREIREKLKQLESNIEMHELWGELNNDDHIKTNRTTHLIISDIMNHLRRDNPVVSLEGPYVADGQVQVLLNNLNFFEVALKANGLMRGMLDVDDDEVHDKNTREIISRVNEVLKWFNWKNADNQRISVEYIDLFVESIDAELNSGVVIRSIYEGNEILCKTVPASLISLLVDKIFKNGRFPHYLELLLSLTHIGEKTMLDNQYEIVKQLTALNRVNEVVYLPASPESTEYRERCLLMKDSLGNDDVELRELPDELAYHFMLLELLGNCTMGKSNISSVEAKLQSLYDFRHLLYAINDKHTSLLGKLNMAYFLLHSFIDVETVIPSLDKEPLLWQYLSSLPTVISDARDELVQLEKSSWDNKRVSRCRISYALISVHIIKGFFVLYFDMTRFSDKPAALVVSDEDNVEYDDDDDDDLEVKEEKNRSRNKNEFDIKNWTVANFEFVIGKLHDAITKMHDVDSRYLDNTFKLVMFDTIEILASHSTNPEIQYKEMTAPMTTRSKSADFGQHDVHHVFAEFESTIKASANVRAKVELERIELIEVIEKLPRIQDNVNSDLRYQPLIKKLVDHVRCCIRVDKDKKSMDEEKGQTSIWVINIFRTMIERKWGMSINERDEDGGQEQDDAAFEIQQTLNDSGAVSLCLDLIAVGIDEELVLEAIKLLVALLFREGGNGVVQETIRVHLTNGHSESFFIACREIIRKLMSWHQWNENNKPVFGDGDEEVVVEDIPETILILRLLQLSCEGHYAPNQDLIRDQPKNSRTTNLLDDFVAYLCQLSRFHSTNASTACQAVSNVVVEVLQGPCVSNQDHLVLNTELLETLNRLMRLRPISDEEMESSMELKTTVIDMFQALLEGHCGSGDSKIFDRVLAVIHLDVLQLLCFDQISKVSAQPEANPTLIAIEGALKAGEEKPEEEEEEEADVEEVKDPEISEFQIEVLVLLEMLCDYRAELRDKIKLPDYMKNALGTEIGGVEVVWRGELQRRFFHIPEICKDLAKSSKNLVVEEVDRSNQESKLLDFLTKVKDLYREIQHQQVLKEMKIAKLFSRRNQDMATWISFYLAILINLLLIGYYKKSDTDDMAVEMEPTVLKVIIGLSLFQIAFSVFSFVLFVIVRVPVRFRILSDSEPFVQAVIKTATDGLTMYYFLYCVVAVLAATVSYGFMPILLLDIVVKNSTTRDVLLSVLFPIKQLTMTAVLSCFIVYIFAMIIFLEFRLDLIDDFVGDCDSLWSCLKFSIGYGLRMGGGIGDMMSHSLHKRFPLDFIFYIIVLIVLLNIIFGIIIDTFGELRTMKNDRFKDTTEKCFVCGIDKVVFDRASNSVNGFRDHIKSDHNMWNYLYFIVFIWEQDRDDDDGLEQYVRRCIDKNDLSWFPLDKAMTLEVPPEPECEDDGKDNFRAIYQSIESIKMTLDALTNNSSNQASGGGHETQQQQDDLN